MDTVLSLCKTYCSIPRFDFRENKTYKPEMYDVEANQTKNDLVKKIAKRSIEVVDLTGD